LTIWHCIFSAELTKTHSFSAHWVIIYLSEGLGK